MSEALVRKLFTDRFFNLYGPAEAVDPKSFVGEYVHALAGNAAELLKPAADHVIAEHKYRNWPTVGECVAAVRTIAERAAAARLRAPPPVEPRPIYSADARERVAALVEEAKASLTKATPPHPRPKLPDVGREAFEKMQRESPNPHLHRKPGR